VVERRAERDDPVGRNLADRRLQADQAAGGGRDADGPARIGAERGERHARRNGGGRSPGGTAGEARRIERMAGWTVCRVLAGRSERELVQVGLADHDGTGVAQPRDRRALAAGDATGPDV
jgi:hypothetical protein